LAVLGFYPNFPENVHKTVQLHTSISNGTLQRVLTETLNRLNSETVNLGEDAVTPTPRRMANLEVGIAEDNGFNYLDTEEKERLLKTINARNLQTVDLFCAIRYCKVHDEDKRPMRFDYYMLRLTFSKKAVEMRVFHEKGPMHTTPDELAQFLINRINASFSKRVLKPFEAPY
jgi:hypothetical protein